MRVRFPHWSNKPINKIMKEVTVNGHVFYIGVHQGIIVLYENRDSTDWVSIYSKHITMDERRQIKESAAYKELLYGIINE